MKSIFYPSEDINDIIESEESEFYKGGIGSGVKGHQTARQKLSAKLSAKGIPKEKHHLYGNAKTRQEEQEHSRGGTAGMPLLKKPESK